MGLMNTSISRRAALAALSSGLLQLAGCGGSQHGDPAAAAPVASSPVLPPAPAPARTFAYVANPSKGNISIFEVVEGGALNFVDEVGAGADVLSVAVHPSGRFAYAVNNGDNSVSGYRIDPATGMLSPIGEFTTGLQPQQMRIHPSGRFACVGNVGADTISVYTIADDGQLTDHRSVDLVGTSLGGLAFNAAGSFLYVASDNVVVSYSVDGNNGELEQLNSVGSSRASSDIAVAPSGRFAYVVSPDGVVEVYPIAETGDLHAPNQVLAGTSPQTMAIDPAGLFAYVANFGDDTLSLYTIDQDNGMLLSVTPPTVPTGGQPGGVAISPSGNAVYVTSSTGDSVDVFTLNRSTGELERLGAPIAAGAGAYGITVVSIPG